MCKQRKHVDVKLTVLNASIGPDLVVLSIFTVVARPIRGNS